MINNLKNKIYNLLRWSEKYTKTDMVYLAKGGSWMTLGQIIASISSFLLAIAFANLLPKETYGTYKYILSLLSILAIPTLRGMDTAIMKSVAKGYEGSLLKALKTKIKWGLLGGFVSLILSGYYFFNNNLDLTFSFLIAAVFLPFMDTLLIYNAYLHGKKLFNIATRYRIITQTSSIAAIIITVFFLKNIFLIIFIYFISNTLLNFLFLKLTLRKHKPNDKTENSTISYGKHLSLISISSGLISNFDKILLWHFLGAAPVAIYSIAIAPVVQLRSFFKPITSLSIPKLSDADVEVLKKTLPAKILKMFLIMLIIVVLYIIFAPFIFKIFFPQYLDSIKYTQIYALVLLFFPKKLMGVSIMLHANKKNLYIAGVLPPIILALMLLILTPFYGITGAVYAAVISEVFTVLMTIYFFKKL